MGRPWSVITLPIGVAPVLSEPLKQSVQEMLLLEDAERCAVEEWSKLAELILEMMDCRWTDEGLPEAVV